MSEHNGKGRIPHLLVSTKAAAIVAYFPPDPMVIAPTGMEPVATAAAELIKMVI